MIASTVGELRELIAGLSDDMPIRSMDDDVPVIFVAEYDDIPDGMDRPPPTLVIEC
jgi:hypothetical protein